MDSLLFLMFLSIYLVSITGNTFTVVPVVADQHLHIPVFFFLGSLACLEIFYSSNILPRILLSYLRQKSGDRRVETEAFQCRGVLPNTISSAAWQLQSVTSWQQCRMTGTWQCAGPCTIQPSQAPGSASSWALHLG